MTAAESNYHASKRRSLSGQDLVSCYGNVVLAANAIVGDFVVLGYPKEARIEQHRYNRNALWSELSQITTTIEADTIIGNHVAVGEGTIIRAASVLEDGCRLGYNCDVGERARVMYGAFVCDRVTIGRRARVAGFICDACSIGDDATVMGQLVHEYTQPHQEWGIEEAAPTIEPRAVVAYGSVIVGGVTIGANSYVAAGAVVTKDVPPRSVVIGTNQIIPASEWRGSKIPPGFWDWEGAAP